MVCPTALLPTQLCNSSSDILRLFIAEGMWRKKGGEKRQPRSPRSWIENTHQISIPVGHQSTKKVSGGTSLVYLQQTFFQHSIQLPSCWKLLNLIIITFSCSVKLLFFFHPNIPAVPSALICPGSFLCAAAVQQQKSKQEAGHLPEEWKALHSRAAMHCILPVPKARSRPSAPSTAAQSQLSGLFTTKGTTAVQVGPTDNVLFKLQNNKKHTDWAILKPQPHMTLKRVCKTGNDFKMRILKYLPCCWSPLGTHTSPLKHNVRKWYWFTPTCTQAHQPVTSFKCFAGALTQLYPEAGQFQPKGNISLTREQAALARGTRVSSAMHCSARAVSWTLTPLLCPSETHTTSS